MDDDFITSLLNKTAEDETRLTHVEKSKVLLHVTRLMMRKREKVSFCYNYVDNSNRI
jgi:hypothetical protein